MLKITLEHPTYIFDDIEERIIYYFKNKKMIEMEYFYFELFKTIHNCKNAYELMCKMFL